MMYIHHLHDIIVEKQFGNMSRGILKRFLDKRVTLTNLCTP